jgi:hypothetical protein
MIQKTKRPADAAASAGPREIDQLAREIDPSNSPKPDQLQAPLLADTVGESDLAYFRRRPNISSRKRLAFEGEPPAGVLERDEYDNVAFINVRLVRDAAGKPATILREIVYGEWGTA